MYNSHAAQPDAVACLIHTCLTHCLHRREEPWMCLSELALHHRTLVLTFLSAPTAGRLWWECSIHLLSPCMEHWRLFEAPWVLSKLSGGSLAKWSKVLGTEFESGCGFKLSHWNKRPSLRIYEGIALPSKPAILYERRWRGSGHLFKCYKVTSFWTIH